MFSFLKPKSKGCLASKTKEEKIVFFRSLAAFALTDEQFFTEQYLDLLPHERKEFGDWVIEDLERKKSIKSMLNIMQKLLP